MGLALFLASFFLLATASSFARHLEGEQGHNHSTLRLTLYHVLGHDSPLTSQSTPSSSELLSHDQARVEHLFGPKSLSKPMNAIPQNMGNYYVKIGLGTPPKDYSVMVDTGSSFCWLQCQPWDKEAGSIFDPSASTTYKSLSCTTPECNSLKEATQSEGHCTSSKKCQYTAHYVDGSYSIGNLSQDSLTLTQSETLPGFVFGCGQHNEKQIESFGQSAGLFGMSRNNLSMISQLSVKYGHDFSYCLPTAHGGGGGLLSMGRDSLKGPSYKFTPMLNSPDSRSYGLRLSAIVVAGKTLGLAEAYYYKSPTIIDSGTVVTRLPTSLYAILRAEFKRIMSSKHETTQASDILDTCYKGSLKEMSDDVPEVRMVFQGEADLFLAPHNILVDGSEGAMCLAFANNSLTNEISIIGNIQLQTFSVAYDVLNSRIGFAAGGCS